MCMSRGYSLCEVTVTKKVEFFSQFKCGCGTSLAVSGSDSTLPLPTAWFNL